MSSNAKRWFDQMTTKLARQYEERLEAAALKELAEVEAKREEVRTENIQNAQQILAALGMEIQEDEFEFVDERSFSDLVVPSISLDRWRITFDTTGSNHFEKVRLRTWELTDDKSRQGMHLAVRFEWQTADVMRQAMQEAESLLCDDDILTHKGAPDYFYLNIPSVRFEYHGPSDSTKLSVPGDKLQKFAYELTTETERGIEHEDTFWEWVEEVKKWHAEAETFSESRAAQREEHGEVVPLYTFEGTDMGEILKQVIERIAR